MAFQMALAQNMLNFKNTVAIIDPATDEVMLVKTDEEKVFLLKKFLRSF